MNMTTLRRIFNSSTCTLCLVAGLSLASCNGEDDSTATGSGGASTDGALENLGERADDLKEQAGAAWQTFLNEVNQRLSRFEPQVEQVKSAAAQKSDATLDRIVGELDTTMQQARTKYEEIKGKVAESSEEEREELNQLLDKAKELYDEARARLGEVGGGMQPPSLSGGAGGGTGAPID